MVLEELLDERTLAALREIAHADEWSFIDLINVAGLDRKSDLRYCDLRDLDLRGQDLRAFDFTGSDLRGCIRNDSTLIDETTIFSGALLDWIEEDKTPIVQVMQEIERSSSRQSRRSALERLTSEYQSANHINAYLRNAIRGSSSQEAFFDFADFFVSPSPSDVQLIRRKLKELVLQASRRRKYRYASQVSPLHLSSIMQGLQETSNKVLSEIYVSVKEKTVGKSSVSLDPSKYLVSMELSELLAAIEIDAEQHTAPRK